MCLLAVAGSCAPKPLTLTQSRSTWTLANKRMSVGVSKTSGEILFVRDKKTNVLSSSAALRIVDVVAGATFSDRDMSVRGSDVVSTKDSVQLTVRRTNGKDYSVVSKFTVDATSVRVDCEVSCGKPTASEFNIDFLFPIASQKFENVFWPMVGAPFDIHNPGVPKLVYRWGILVPEATVYNPTTDSGVSFIAPIGMPKPGFSFDWQGTYPDNTLAISNFYLAGGGGKNAKASIYIVCHEGDWRPGLGWMVSKYPDYFRAPRSKFPGEGPMSILFSTTSDDWMKRYADIGVKWLEYQYCFPFYGLYAPKGDAWSIIADSDKVSLEEWEKGGAVGAPFGKSVMQNKFNLARKNGISMYLYYQHADVWHQYAEKYYAADIAKDEKGDALPAFNLCRLMNSDPSTKWGKDIRQQARDMLKAFPGIDGLLWDELFYVNYDFAHDDGITMRGSRPCYQLGFACEKLVKEVVPLMHRNGKAVWGNVPSSVEVIHGIDGILIESPDSYAETMQYLTIAKPMVLLSYDKDIKATEDKLKRCILFGAFPGLTEEQFPKGEDGRSLERRYKPMIDRLTGREWVLTAHALTLPPNVRGNIFKTKTNYLVTLITPEATQLGDSKPTVVRVPVSIKVADASKIKRCHLLTSEGGPPTALPFTRGQDGVINAVVPSHKVASMVVFGK